MIAVSDRWKEVQAEYLVPLSEIEIEYNVTEPGVQADAAAAGTPEEPFSGAKNITDELLVSEPLYASLERNQWVLDGTFLERPWKTPTADGFISSNLSGDDGAFAVIPTVSITFSQVNLGTVPGLTLVWSKGYDEWAVSYRVTAYNGSAQVAQVTVEDNASAMSYAWAAIQGYDRIKIEILKWCLPHRRARLLECLIGVKQIYTKVDLMGFSHEQTADLLSGELPKNSIVFKLDNSTSKWNPENPGGAEQYLIEKQTLIVRYGFRIDGVMEWIKAGTFYMSEWKTPSNGLEATFTARDILEFCSDPYTGPRSGTLLAMVNAALAQSGIKGETVVLDPVLGTVSSDFTEDIQAYTCAEILQMAANASKCCLWQCRDGFLHIEPLKTTLTDYVIGELSNGLNNSLKHPEFNLTKELKSVSVNQGLGTAESSATGNIQEVDNPLITTAATAKGVAEWCRDCLKGRKLLSGVFRADPRMDALDKITVVSKYGSSPVYVTRILYEYGGSFHGTYEGRVAE